MGNELDPPLARPDDGEPFPADTLLETAWVIIANAGEGDWGRESPDWCRAARRWRAGYLAVLRAQREGAAGSGASAG